MRKMFGRISKADGGREKGEGSREIEEGISIHLFFSWTEGGGEGVVGSGGGLPISR